MGVGGGAQNPAYRDLIGGLIVPKCHSHGSEMLGPIHCSKPYNESVIVSPPPCRHSSPDSEKEGSWVVKGSLHQTLDLKV
ncbi:hypothetical protein AAFF_G00166590 [Aldrovandia affinis]|uniref:Uncharacterized protein n=1 Tax=Aldrovandia affinis TaxID=143900 RepID=A0AAD7RMC9_9TELE|nr:hypothetical protein AAFF_G00166590 [Aldrovandia affinis]